MAQTGQRSVVMVRRYIRDGELFRPDNAATVGALTLTGKSAVERTGRTTLARGAILAREVPAMSVAQFPARVRLMSLLAGLWVAGFAAPSLAAPSRAPLQVVVPQEDRFAPFVVTIHAGQSVEWINRDTDDHTVVSDDPFNTSGHKRTDHLLPGTDSNGGVPGRFVLRFDRPGTFTYYCRFHAHLDSANQPVAPGPSGGIKDALGNFGTPMMGVVTVLGEGE